jgi:hypothetical protein
MTLLGPGHSGRMFVLSAGVAVLLIWGILYLFFREWRARYRERAFYGKTQVVATLEPLRALLPPQVDAEAWRNAVDETRAMLLTVTGSNLLDVKAIDSLRLELAHHVRQASIQPATALRELAEIWNEESERGEFLFRDSRSQSGKRHLRPKVIPSYAESRVVPAIDALASIEPPGVDAGDWQEAVGETREMLLALTDDRSIDVSRLQMLRDRLVQKVDQARARPETALDRMAAIWDQLAPPGDGHHTRPKILPKRREEFTRGRAASPLR